MYSQLYDFDATRDELCLVIFHSTHRTERQWLLICELLLWGRERVVTLTLCPSPAAYVCGTVNSCTYHYMGWEHTCSRDSSIGLAGTGGTNIMEVCLGGQGSV